MAGTPTAIDAIEILSGMASVLGKCLYEVVHRFCHLGKIGGEGGPVVFFQIDVHRIVASPRRPEMRCPKTLQIGWYALGARTGDEKIATELEIECFQIVVVGMLTQQTVGGYVLFVVFPRRHA